jgi:uncharacterized protein YodC (DUF2158 family)
MVIEKLEGQKAYCVWIDKSGRKHQKAYDLAMLEVNEDWDSQQAVLAPAVGSVVALKCGGPSMTIRKIEGDKAWCVWRNGNKDHEKTFGLVTLAADEAINGPLDQPIMVG